ncbi:MAG: class I SAM-dependent methyltransferase [Candidatus Marsarchaeota archaeon]|nr:class I SAM-dependent methyltransferase [Candidatus Marsarchaeota archaeon]
MKYVVCALCLSDNTDVIAASPRPELPHATKVRCRSCGLIYSQPMADEDELRTYYDRYYTDGSHSSYLTTRADASHLAASRAKVREILRFKSSGRFLDIGCGVGYVLVAARELGFSVDGIEPAEAAVRKGNQEFGLNIRCGTIESVKLEPASYDVIYSWHVIEHVRELSSFVRHIRELLAPNGVVLIGTDNHAARAYGLLRRWYHLRGKVPPIYDGHEHTYGFTRATLCRLLKEASFSILQTRVFRRPYAGPYIGTTPGQVLKKWIKGTSSVYLEVYATC